MDLIVIRHGETDYNSRGVVHGHSRGALSALGRQQARDLAVKLKDERVATIYSSSFQRCIETAELLSVYHKKVPLQLTPELQEMHGGMMNKVEVSLKNVIRGIRLLKLLHLKTPGGESWEELCARVENFLNEAYEKHQHDTIVLVTHGITMQAIRSLLEDKRGNKFKLQEVPNCMAWKMQMSKIINLKR
jgi:broad specificity phosphatase PhoE